MRTLHNVALVAEAAESYLLCADPSNWFDVHTSQRRRSQEYPPNVHYVAVPMAAVTVSNTRIFGHFN